jgi:acetylornithine deacetylase/succinyl-diaminopimelate desuccinylase-like protein
MSLAPDPAVRAYIDEHLDGWVGELAAWAAVPSVSAVSDHAADLARSAEVAEQRLRGVGFPEVRIWPTEGSSAVYASWPAQEADAPTVLVYSHHDVRAVDAEQWRTTRPFHPILRGDRLFGRGTSDAKAQVLCHLWALRTHLAVTGSGAPALNVRVLIDGEEEIGSPHLADLLEKHADHLRSDVVVFSDTMLWSLDGAAVCTSVRGAIIAHLEIRGAERDIHSGLVSGTGLDALAELCRVLGRLHDDRGRVAIPGFYDDVRPPTDAQRAALAALPFDTDDWLRRTGCFALAGEEGWSAPERMWWRPAAEVTMLHGGEPDGPARAVTPAVARADIGLRLVPDQRVEDAVEQLRRWVADQVRPGFKHTFSSPPINEDPYTTPSDLPALAALERAVGRAQAQPVIRIGNGGSGPAARLARALDAPVVFYGTGLPEDRWHDADERTELRALRQGVETLAYLYAELPQALRS